MNPFYHQLAGGYSVAPHCGVQCNVRVFPWTEEFLEGDTVVHYFEYDDMTNEAFLQDRMRVWAAFFEKRAQDAQRLSSKKI